MTRKDYELIADTIRTIPLIGMAEQWRVAVAFADALQETNDRFDRKRFLRACSPIGSDFSVEDTEGGDV